MLYAWGANANGRTGLGKTAGNTPVPTQVGSGVDWEFASAGNQYALGAMTDGSLWAWGSNNNGKTGLNITSTANDAGTLTPQRVTDFTE